MKTTFSKISVFFVFSFSTTVFANDIWNPTTYNLLRPNNQQKLDNFSKEVFSKLPSTMAESLKNKIEINFKTLDSGNELTAPGCLDSEEVANALQKKIAADFDGLKTDENIDAKTNQKNAAVYGETVEPKQNGQKFLVYLNQKFLLVILNGSENAKSFPCGHKNFYRLAQATLIHELSHVYDTLNVTASLNPQERNLRLQCAAAFGPVPVRQMPTWCRDYVNQTKSVSDRPAWKNLMNWNRGFFVTKDENVLALRSPDAYEKTNLSEAFAVNMEYFVLDPEYGCRRPEIDSFLRAYLKVTAVEKPVCSPNPFIRYSNSLSQVSLDFSRLYQVHYLMAAPGKSVESRFGHSMFRLVFCSPKRKVPGPECLQDIDQHVVISFRANISGIQQNNWDGLTGKYPSQMFVYTLPEIISEYTVSEFRDLISYPLKLTAAENKRFIERVLQEYWEYQGRYYFISNNCATETLDFLKGVIFRNNFLKKVATIETPMSVHDFLKENNLIDSDAMKDANQEGRFYFSSYKKVIAKSLQQIDQGQNVPDTVEDFANKFSAAKRKDLYNKLVKNLTSNEQIKGYAIQFYRLERAISYYLDAQRKHLAESVIAQGAASNKINNLYRENIRKIMLLRARFSPWFMAKNGYGIPLTAELKTDDAIENEQREAGEAFQKIDESLRRDFPEVDNSIKEVNSNLLYFFNEIKRTVVIPNKQP
ncbi:MAG: DUF7844 domain-containing protein [Bdellovibrio sp.]